MAEDAECIFCKIVAKKIPAKISYEDDKVIAFDDIRPQAPVHVIIVPKRHIGTLADTGAQDTVLLGALISAAAAIARERGVSDTGYRTVINCNKDGGQEVPHLHLHLLGGRAMCWPPG